MAKRPRRNHGAAFKGKGGIGGDKRGENAYRTGGAIPGTSQSDHDMEETAIGGCRRSVCQREKDRGGAQRKRTSCKDRTACNGE